uniref:Trafficking protein particle complex subunit 8 n=1 Tax=Steinernema glaseri TaxID=37863 RepID=A0A1I7ZCP8_9BILA
MTPALGSAPRSEFAMQETWLGSAPSARVGSVARSRIGLWTDCRARIGRAQKMIEAVQSGFAPPVAVLTSEHAESICAKNRLTFADLLCPFTTVCTTVKDPNQQPVKSRFRLELRDVQRHGFLLTLTALPHVLKEAVGAAAAKGAEDWSQAYRDALFSWFESGKHEFLKSYLCSMFVVSAHEPNPLGELSRLVQLQYAQQHGNSDNTLGPRHCADPKWFIPNILKYYVLLYDISVGGDDCSAAKATFESMCKTYGEKNCYFLRINSGQDGASLPDPWRLSLETRYRGLAAGLSTARKNLLALSTPKTFDTYLHDGLSEGRDAPPIPLSSPLSVAAHHSSEPRLLSSPISTVSSAVSPHSPIFSTTSHGLSIPTLPNIENGTSSVTAPPFPSPIVEASSPESVFDFSGPHGQCLNAEDRQRVTSMIEAFVNDALVPFAEKQMRTLSENLSGRRGFSKSIFSGMRKWVGSSSTGQLGATPMTYSSESTEMQLRRLADLAFLFGLYSYAYPIYHSLRKDFATDQAWLYHAGASEMAAISKFLSEEQTIVFKDFPDHYMTSAMEYYMNSCGQNLLAVRSALLACLMFQELAAKEKVAEQRGLGKRYPSGTGFRVLCQG